MYFFDCWYCEKLPVFFQSYRPTPFCPYPSLLSLVFCLSLYCISFYLTLWIYLFILSRQLGPNLFWKSHISYSRNLSWQTICPSAILSSYVCYPLTIQSLCYPFCHPFWVFNSGFFSSPRLARALSTCPLTSTPLILDSARALAPLRLVVSLQFKPLRWDLFEVWHPPNDP